MILKVLGILDILSGICFWLNIVFKFFPDYFIFIISFYLIIKGVLFILSKDIASILDILSGIIIYASLTFSIPFFIVVIIAFFLIQKGILSLIS